MTLTQALSNADAANANWLEAAAIYAGFVANGSPQPQTGNALAVATAALTTLKATQGPINTAFSAL